nr:hypothetical protein [Tanacetum cinerariifolium]
EDFTFQIENRDHKKQEKMYYPRFTNAFIHHFITKDKSTLMRNRMFMHTARDDSILIRDSDAYKTYLAYATGSASPKMKRKLKKHASPSKKRTIVTIEEEEPKPAKKVVPSKKPSTKRQSSGVQIRDTPGMYVSKKKAPAKVARSGSSEGADSETEVPDKPKGKSIDTRVPDMSKSDSFESEYKSWGDSGDEDANDQQGDDERTKSYDELNETDNPKTSDNEEEIQDDEFKSKAKSSYHVLMESILEDEDAMDEGVAAKQKKRKPDDADKDEGPFDGSNQGLKRRITNKDTKQSKKAKESKHDVYSTKRILAVTNVKVKKWYGYGHLGENENRLYNLKGDVIMYLAASLRMFTRRIVIQKRVDHKPYSAYSNPQGFIYVDKLGRNRLMCSHGIYKFSDSTLISLRDTLKDMAINLNTGYSSFMPRRKWSSLDKKRSRIMINDIDHQLLDRRLIRSLEKFVGGREYGEDLRMLQRTI